MINSIKVSRVLVVEDEPRLRELLLDVIPEMGFTAAAARSAEEARKLMEADPFDIIILDLHLPVMNGMDFFQQLRQRWTATQVIILTGFGDLDSARQAIRMDVVDFLIKPCRLNELESSLDRARRRLGSSRNTTPEVAPQPTVGPTLADNERALILAALERNHGNRTVAAAELGISRRTLHYRLNEYRCDSESASQPS